MVRHFAFFRQLTGEYIREWAGPVPAPSAWVTRLGWPWLLNRWATLVSQPQRGEIGLDVTHIGWPVGDFCYCTCDVVDRRLDCGPPRHYIEVHLTTGEIVANQESHRPIRSAVPGQRVLDITGTALEPYHGQLFGRFVPFEGRLIFEPARHVPRLRKALAAAAADLAPVRPSVPVSVLRGQS